MRHTRWLAGGMAALLIGVTAPTLAQEIKIQTRPPGEEVKPEIVAPPLHDQMSRPDHDDFYPDGPKVRHDPAFIEPLAVPIETSNGTGEVGVSGWTTPAIPVGPAVIGRRDNNGWLSFGFSAVWGGPPTAKPPARR